MDIIKLKAGLLCLGMSIKDNTKEILLKEYPHFSEKGFIDAVNAKILGSNMSISVAEKYSEKSKYILEKIGDKYYVWDKDEKIEITFFQNLPKTGTVIDNIARLHADGCINIWPSTSCCYDKPDLKCRFCSLEKKNSAPIPVDVMADGLKKLFEQIPPWTLNLSGGTYMNPDFMADYWCDLAKSVRKFSDCSIAVEFAPPADLSKLQKMKDSGINVAIMNLEIASPELRKKICPGKSQISYEHYHEAMKKAVEIFGWGQVSSVLIGGIQPEEDIIKECEILSSMGVFPTIMPFRPMDNCDMKEFSSCEPESLIRMSMKLGAMLVKNKLNPCLQEGCTKCGGCSIENDCYAKQK